MNGFQFGVQFMLLSSRTPTRFTNTSKKNKSKEERKTERARQTIKEKHYTIHNAKTYSAIAILVSPADNKLASLPHLLFPYTNGKQRKPVAKTSENRTHRPNPATFG